MGFQIAFSLQTSNMSRIFQTLGANPQSLGLFFLLPPLVGIISQPILGYLSDRTWSNRFGRRLPYLIMGTLLAVLVMLLLPNIGLLHLGYGSVMTLGLAAILVLIFDFGINTNVLVYRMLLADQINKQDQDLAWNWQSIWRSVGNIVAFLLPACLAFLGISNVAPKGVVPFTVVVAFGLGALILGLISWFTVKHVKEKKPKDFDKNVQTESFFKVLAHASKTFWGIALVEFFAMFAVQYMWTYTTGSLSINIWHTTNPTSAGYQAAGNWFGVVQAVLAVVSILGGLLLNKFLTLKNRRLLFSLGLLIGSIGFVLLAFTHIKIMTVVAFILIGIAWISLLAIPGVILTNSFTGKNDGTYIGLFNCSQFFPQLMASLSSFIVFPLLGSFMPHMLLVSAGGFLLSGLSIWLVPDHPNLSLN